MGVSCYVLDRNVLWHLQTSHKQFQRTLERSSINEKIMSLKAGKKMNMQEIYV